MMPVLALMLALLAPQAPARPNGGVTQLAGASTCPGGFEPTFDVLPGVSAPGPYFAGTISALVVFDDGLGGGPELYVGGGFPRSGGVDRPYLARWNGERWDDVGGGVDGPVNALLVFDDGSGPALYVGGSFTTAGGTSASRIARWDGASWSSPAGGVIGGSFPFVRALAVFDAGSGPELHVAGSFTFAGGVTVNNVARWDGSAWHALAGGTNNWINALTVFDDGSGPVLAAAGYFTSPANHVASWNGSGWSAFGAGLGTASEQVTALAAYDDGSGSALYAGGYFVSASGMAVNHVARWTGSLWTALGTGVGNSVLTSASVTVGSLFVYDDGLGDGPCLYAGGNFNRAGTVQARSIARWNGAAWSRLADGMAPINGSAYVGAMVVFDDGDGPMLHVGGNIPTADDLHAYSLARWDGVAWSLPGHGLNDQVLALEVFDDGLGGGPALYAGGRFEFVGGERHEAIARWDGVNWAGLGSGLNYPSSTPSSAQGLANDLLVHDDGSGSALYVTGSFRTAGGSPAVSIARWDGLGWSALGAGLDGTGMALVTFDDGGGTALYAGGAFTRAGGIGASNVARWDGASWAPLGSGANGLVRAFAVFDDGSGAALYAGGDFTQAGGLAASRIARWDGVSWSPLAGGTDASVLALAVFDDGGGPALYVGGSFEHVDGQTIDRLARWDGTSWTTVAGGMHGGPTPGHVRALTVFDDGPGPALYAGGDFVVAGGVQCRNLARWDGTSWSPLGLGVINDTRQNQVQCLTAFDARCGRELYVGGGFTLALESGDAYLTRWQGCRDSDPPLLACPPSLGADDPLASPLGEVITFSVTASDDCDPTPSVVCTPPSGSLFPPGVTTVHCTATDLSGNASQCSFEVHVNRRVRRR